MRRPSRLGRLVAAMVAVLVGCGRGPGEGGAGQGAGLAGGAAAGAFLERYLDGDGRVVRHDQGGDTVSEGQAYAMLLTAASGDRDRFERAWGWAREHLRRPDGLLSWHWRDGRVVDPSPASDADLDAARALVMAGRRFDDPALTEAGVELGRAVLDHETVEVGDDLVLVAGPWAVERRVVNPSYLALCAFADLQKASGDARWGRMAGGAERVLRDLTEGGRLPPDWAVVDRRGSARPIGRPDEPERPARYGLDAARVPARLAEDCGGPGPGLAARLWPALRGLDGRGAAIAYDLDGARQDRNDHPTGLVGAAAAARAAGDTAAAGQLMAQAAEQDRRVPTYYGSAWVALGAAWLGVEPGKETR